MSNSTQGYLKSGGESFSIRAVSIQLLDQRGEHVFYFYSALSQFPMVAPKVRPVMRAKYST